jgi:poly-gamma-glutamate synthesis protein (capsule biosynthesis protein)
LSGVRRVGSGLALWALVAGLAVAVGVLGSPAERAEASDWPLGLVSLDTVFGETRTDLTDLDPTRLHTLLVTGDVALVRMVNVTTLERDDFEWPFREVASLMRAADLTLVNLEGPLVPDCPLRYTSLVFCGDSRNAAGLEFAGVDVAALANNHIFNHGQVGLESTRRVLEQAGITYAGHGVVAIHQVDDVRFGFLSYNAVGETVDREQMSEEIHTLRRDADVVVVMFHWGVEYVRIPAPWPGQSGAPRDLARAAIDAGADLVVGSHPHWFQGIEFYRGRLIAYSHGNFVFDQRWSEETLEGMVGLYTFYDYRLIDVQFMPVRIESWGQPRLLEGAERARLLRIMRDASEALEPY